MKRAEEGGVRCARAYKVGFGRECAGGASGDWVVDLVFGFVFALAREKFGEFWRRRRRRKGGKRGGGGSWAGRWAVDLPVHVANLRPISR
jgi:hypothetical protein